MQQTLWVLEDDRGVQLMYKMALGLRYNLSFFDSVASLNDALESSHPRPMLLIADLHLPDQEFIQYLETPRTQINWRHVPFLVVSGVDDLEALRQCYAFGALDFINKPFTTNEIIVKVDRCLVAAKGTRRHLYSVPIPD